MLTVRDLLKMKGDGIWAVSPETSTLDALRYMAAKNIGALLVLDAGILCGIITERDFVYRIAQERAIDIHTPIGEYMTSKVITVTPDTTVDQCLEIMTDRRIRHLPVVLQNGDLIGMISIGDLVKAQVSEQGDTIDNLQKYITGTGYGQ
jgi:CBS domain-containing protein